MLVFHGSLYCATILLRVVQISYESHLIYLSGYLYNSINWLFIITLEPGCFPLPQLVILRATAYISIILLMNGIIIERWAWIQQLLSQTSFVFLVFTSRDRNIAVGIVTGENRILKIHFRALATYFVNDYEKKRRLWISATILPVNFVASLMLSSQIIRGTIFDLLPRKVEFEGW